jgi:nicotinamide mononucleotide transporter
MKTKLSPMAAVAAVEFILVATLSIWLKVDFFSALPLMVSAAVMFMQTRVSRYAFLVGGANSIIYSISYFFMQLYGQASSALFFSFPLQMLTFFNWKRSTRKGKTEIKRLSPKGRLMLFGIMAAAWLVLYALFSLFDSPWLVLDNTVTVIGVVTTVLCLLRYSEYSVLQIVTSCVNLGMFIAMTRTDPTRAVWMVHSAYCIICATVTFAKTRKGIKNDD